MVEKWTKNIWKGKYQKLVNATSDQTLALVFMTKSLTSIKKTKGKVNILIKLAKMLTLKEGRILMRTFVIS